jgi:hypothetical protein
MRIMFVIVVSVLYTLDDRRCLSNGSNGKGLSISDGVDIADACWAERRDRDDGEVGSSSPWFCRLRSACEGGGEETSIRREEVGRELIVSICLF